MKIELLLKCNLEINTEDPEVAESLAKIHADHIRRNCTQTDLQYYGMSLAPELEAKTKELSLSAQGMIRVFKEIGEHFKV